MRFPNVEVKRKIGTMVYYYLPKNEIIIIDPGYEGGDIHIYEKIKKINAIQLQKTLEKYLNGDELSNINIIQIKEINDKSLKPEILKTKGNRRE